MSKGMSRAKESLAGALRIVEALLTTQRQAFRKPVTLEYPETQRPAHRRFRGLHELKRYEDGLERCIGCALCVAACPANAIFVQAGENTDQERYSPGERYARVYEINVIRCMFCGYCEDACPTYAIVLENQYEIAGTTREGMIYTKEMLLVDPPSPERSTPRQVEPGRPPLDPLPSSLRYAGRVARGTGGNAAKEIGT